MLDEANSRMRDFFDIHALSENHHFDGDILRRAVRATFERRRTPIPESLPLAMTPAFAAIRAKQTQWQGFLGKSGLSSAPTQMSDVVRGVPRADHHRSAGQRDTQSVRAH
jgi:hypothetical protein